MNRTNVIEACGLGKRYWRTWALRDCSLAVPAGRVVALVGPNGAGKTTLLNLAAGLTSPTNGSIAVLGGQRPGSSAARAGIGFVAQDAPLYRHLSVADTVHLARNLNRAWDQAGAEARLADLGLGMSRKVGQLSGGQRAQLALTVALARQPALLILDEPLASIDPLARHDFMASLMASVAERGLSVVLSSHLVTELERIADYLIVLNRGRVQLAGDVDGLLTRHRLLTGPASASSPDPGRFAVVRSLRAGAQVQLLVRTPGDGDLGLSGFESQPVDFEELVLGYLREPGASWLPGPAATAASGASALPA